MINTVYAFFQGAPGSLFVQHQWNLLPKAAQTASKVAGVAAFTFALSCIAYKIYRKLPDRAAEQITPPTPPPEPPPKEIKDHGNNSPSVKDKGHVWTKKVKKALKKAPKAPSSETVTSSTTPATQNTDLEKLKKLLPGKDLICDTSRGKGMNLADFLMQTLIHLDRSTSCSVNDKKFFEVTFKEGSEFRFTSLGSNAPFSLKEQIAATGLLFAIRPTIHIAKTIKGRIVQRSTRTDIVLDQGSISMKCLGFEAHLERIGVFEQANDKGHYVSVEGLYKGELSNMSLDHAFFARTVDCNLP